MAVAFFPTGVLGLLLYKTIKQYLFTPMVVCLALCIGGIVLLFLETLTAKLKTRQLGYKEYFFLGIFQCLAFIPGVSRSAATILGGRLLGATREEAVKFSFLLAIPTILSASGYSLLKISYPISLHEIYLLIVG